MTKRVRDVMTSAPWTLPASCPLQDAARLMRSWDAREVFVVDNGRLCGVLTDTDIIVVAIASGRSPTELTAGECHTRDALRLEVDEPLPHALAYMRLHQVDRVPVVDGDQLLGAVWMNDLERVTEAERRDPTTHVVSLLARRQPAAESPVLRCSARPATVRARVCLGQGRRQLCTRPVRGTASNPG
jgi:CBS domain-containing protein